MPYIQNVDAVQKWATLAVLEAKIAAHGEEIHSELSRIMYYENPNYLPFKSVAAYIDSMHIDVPIFDQHPSAEPVTEQVVKELLSDYGFIADNIAVTITKKKRRFKYEYYYCVTFAVAFGPIQDE